MAKRFNIRMAGVGGQGVVTGSHILSTAVINAGGESTIVPFYGSEKRMAPVESYVRVSDEPIYEIGEITFPHIIIIFHRSEEHTSELQSPYDLVCRLLLEKKNY